MALRLLLSRIEVRVLQKPLDHITALQGCTLTILLGPPHEVAVFVGTLDFLYTSCDMIIFQSSFESKHDQWMRTAVTKCTFNNTKTDKYCPILNPQRNRVV